MNQNIPRYRIYTGKYKIIKSYILDHLQQKGKKTFLKNSKKTLFLTYFRPILSILVKEKSQSFRKNWARSRLSPAKVLYLYVQYVVKLDSEFREKCIAEE